MASLTTRAAERLQRELVRRLLPSRLRVGPETYFSWPLPRVVAFPADPPYEVTIGGYCSVAGGVEFIVGGEHYTERISTFPFPPGAGPRSKGPIVVGSDVWIGKGAMLLSGVTVGDGAVIGARSVVTRDIRPYAVVAGNPATELRRRFGDREIEQLLDLAWWSWPRAEVKAVVPLLLGTDVAPLLAYAETRRASPRAAAVVH